MARQRFSTAQEVFDTFPSACDDIRAAPTAEAPMTFLEALRNSGTPEDAVTFLAYALGRREAVWWAAQSVRLLGRIGAGQEDAMLLAAEDWVRDPEDQRRREALRLGMGSDRRLATTWVALAAAWSGGNVAPGQGAVMATPEMTPKAVRTGILVALATVTARERASRLQLCVDAGLRLMKAEA
ncbi:DUF6931 family protein [Methylobacterium sp. J-068]|uniref:DUF6931 family protein n=1 Tax=Methylobacterium sp. J-068 TaxID=2836649 RepID=UPI001FBA8018|nr:hypothetical protein [Methylobacterium sp. J-068]MCJ2033865.1 hypothetical protein [Methylobacterium sp. J-068]